MLINLELVTVIKLVPLITPPIPLPVLFSKRELSTNVLIDEIITDEGSITLLDLKEQLLDDLELERRRGINQIIKE